MYFFNLYLFVTDLKNTTHVEKKQTYYLQLSKTKMPLSALSKHQWKQSEVKIVVFSVWNRWKRFFKCSQLLFYCVFRLHNDPFGYIYSYPLWVFSYIVCIAALGIFILSNTWQLFENKITKWLNLKHCLPSALVKGLHQSLFFNT